MNILNKGNPKEEAEDFKIFRSQLCFGFTETLALFIPPWGGIHKENPIDDQEK